MRLPSASTKHRFRDWRKIAPIALCSSLVLAGCTTYQPLPLVPQDTSIRQLDQLHIDPSQMSLPALAAHRFDPSDGLDMTEVAMVAVVNNPDLKLARDDLGIARAQSFAAGLLPDPQISLSRDFPAPSAPDLMSAFSYGISFDVTALLTRQASHDAAKSEEKKIELALLWQEWQVVSQARQLFVRVVTQEHLHLVLQQTLKLHETRYDAATTALHAGNLTLDTVSPYLVALEDVRRQLADLERLQNQTRHDLNTLLGLAPDTRLDLVNGFDIPPLDRPAVEDSLRNLPHRRPDLIALEAGYQAQESKFRGAVLAQFPSLNLGLTRARDTSGIYTTGFTAGISVPIFNRNRGNIAIEKATRQRLHDEYQTRLNQAHAEVDRIVVDQTLLERHLAASRDAAVSLQSTADSAARAYQAHHITASNYVDLQSALLTKQTEVIGLEQTALEQRVALQTLLGGEIPVIHNANQVNSHEN
ncbi:MAG: TolC family protein [Burkholderiales bacterium]|nr:TolC family protein [Burkholderiales bacterium]